MPCSPGCAPATRALAARTVSALWAVGLFVTVVTVPMGVNAGTDLDGWAIALAGVSLLLAAMIGAAAWFFDEASSLAWALCPFAAIMVIVLVDLATHDGSVSAQVFFFFPTVYGAALLPRPGAILVTCASLAGELVVVFTQLSVREAVVSSCYMAAALATIAVMLIRSMERQQELVVELARLATIDPLTGLVTRRSFDEAVSSCPGAARRRRGHVTGDLRRGPVQVGQRPLRPPRWRQGARAAVRAAGAGVAPW